MAACMAVPRVSVTLPPRSGTSAVEFTAGDYPVFTTSDARRPILSVGAGKTVGLLVRSYPGNSPEQASACESRGLFDRTGTPEHGEVPRNQYQWRFASTQPTRCPLLLRRSHQWMPSTLMR
jgi:hypothetical protein